MHAALHSATRPHRDHQPQQRRLTCASSSHHSSQHVQRDAVLPSPVDAPDLVPVSGDSLDHRTRSATRWISSLNLLSSNLFHTDSRSNVKISSFEYPAPSNSHCILYNTLDLSPPPSSIRRRERV